MFNSGIQNIDKLDKLLIIGCDPKREAAVLNARIRDRRWLSGDLEIMSLCTPGDLTYKINNLGNDINSLTKSSIQKKISLFFEKADFPMIILGDSVLETKQGKEVHNLVKMIAQKSNLIKEDWNGF